MGLAFSSDSLVEIHRRETPHSPTGLVVFTALQLFFFSSLCGAEIFIEPRIAFTEFSNSAVRFPTGTRSQLTPAGPPKELFGSYSLSAAPPRAAFLIRFIIQDASLESGKPLQLRVDPDFIIRPLLMSLRTPTEGVARDRSAASLSHPPRLFCW